MTPFDIKSPTATYSADPARLTDCQLLAAILQGAGKSTAKAEKEARRLLQDAGGKLRHVLEAAQVPAALAAHEFSLRVMREELQRSDCLTSSALTRQYLRSKMRAYVREVFLIVFLDNQHRVIAIEEPFAGTIDGSSVHPREVVRQALHHNAAAVIYAHNHPSGVAEPSQADVSITRRLKQALELVGIRTLDHVIVGDSECTSLAERGLI